MKTYSHLLIGAYLNEVISETGAAGRAFLYGAMAPDLPLWVMFAGSMLQWVFVQGPPFNEAVEIFSSNFFGNMWWISGHNLLHLPTSLVLAALLVRLGVGILPDRQRHWR